jgi:hypothetical protein
MHAAWINKWFREKVRKNVTPHEIDKIITYLLSENKIACTESSIHNV